MQLLQPLAVEHIGLAPWDVSDPAGIDQQHFEAPLHQQLVERNPVDAGGLHRYRLDLTLMGGLNPTLDGPGRAAALYRGKQFKEAPIFDLKPDLERLFPGARELAD